MPDFSQPEYKIKPRKDLITKEYTCQCFSSLQISEKIKADKRLFQEAKMEFETKLCRKDEQVIAIMYGLSLKFEAKEEQLKGSVIKWAKIFGYNIEIEQCENQC